MDAASAHISPPQIFVKTVFFLIAMTFLHTGSLRPEIFVPELNGIANTVNQLLSLPSNYRKTAV
jgi:hypothetical protein